MKKLKFSFTNLAAFLLLLFISSCSNNRIEADYYKNLFTGEVYDKARFMQFRDSLYTLKFDSLKEKPEVTIHFSDFSNKNYSTILSFQYSIRVGMEYIIRQKNFDKIGMDIPLKTFVSIDGDSLQIGGEQSKPTLINLWFVGCTGCVQEMPALNQIKEKYKDKVNFVAMTFDEKPKVLKFLNKTDFNFTHIAYVNDYIETIGTNPFPENIFVSKQGKIKYIEGGVMGENTEYFEHILDELIE